jgi:hypothetical protein
MIEKRLWGKADFGLLAMFLRDRSVRQWALLKSSPIVIIFSIRPPAQRSRPLKASLYEVSSVYFLRPNGHISINAVRAVFSIWHSKEQFGKKSITMVDIWFTSLLGGRTNPESLLNLDEAFRVLRQWHFTWNEELDQSVVGWLFSIGKFVRLFRNHIKMMTKGHAVRVERYYVFCFAERPRLSERWVSLTESLE